MALLSHNTDFTELLANIRLILRLSNDPTVQKRLKKGLKEKISIFLGAFAFRFILPAIFLSTPFLANAGLLSFISDLFSSSGVGTETQLVSALNSQTMPLLQAAVNANPILAQGGGDITIIGEEALLPETGPSGSLANVDSSASHGHISVYIVRSGDTLSGIAKMFGVSVNTIAWNNDIQRGVIRPGQTLVILPISGVQHTVKKGDTVVSVAKFYKADVTEVLQYNDLSEGAALAVGSVIIIPDGELAPVATSPVTSNLRGAGGPSYQGYYIRPIIGGVKTQGLHGYNGVDLKNYSGAPVLASAAGEVIVARDGGWNGGYGSYVVISHANGTQTLYGHLSAVFVYVGQEAVQGQVVGNLGSTGKSTGPHLHFEIRGAKNPF